MNKQIIKKIAVVAAANGIVAVFKALNAGSEPAKINDQGGSYGKV